MYITPLFTQLWGPILVAIGLGFFFSRKYYVTIYRDLEKESFAVFFFGIFAMMLGMIHVAMHNFWGSLVEVIVSILGWGLLVKGVICVTFPGVAERGGDWAIKTGLFRAAGVITLILGIYLSWFGYFTQF
jgi:hypothetical protein